MIILITGVPGSGKTLYSIGLLRKFLAEGREVYANIDGLKLHGVMPAPEDWRAAPEGSVICYDEAQTIFGSQGTKGGRAEREDIQALEVHRHSGHDLVLITQHPGLIHSHVRRLVGRHHHVFRLFGTPAARVFTQERAIDVDSLADLRSGDVQTWQFPRKDYAAYKSATVHTHKMRIPRVIALPVLGMIVLAVVVAKMFSGNELFQAARAEDAAAVAPTSAPTERATARAREVAATAITERPPAHLGYTACVWNDTRCTCYDADYRPAQLQFTQCLAIAESSWSWMPLPAPQGRAQPGRAPASSGSGPQGFPGQP